jgi:hypothetical protein
LDGPKETRETERGKGTVHLSGRWRSHVIAEIKRTKDVISMEELLGKVIFLVTDESPAQ